MGSAVLDRVEEKETKIKVPIHEKVTLSIEEAAAYSGIGINKVRELANDPRNRIGLSIGRRMLIKRKEFEKLLSEKSYL